jgi:hypothetical protein
VKIQKTLVGGVVVAMFACLACGSDEDVLVNPPPQEQAPIVDPVGDDTADETDDELDDADELHSGDEDTAVECVVADCAAPAMGVACCTIAEDITAVRATEAGQCGTDMAEFGFPGCTQLNQPGVLDAACPPVAFPPGAPPMEGCCTEAGHCGAMETFVGMGCTSNPDSSTWVPCGG